eukprot:2440420-Rhodomonas_salina.1
MEVMESMTDSWYCTARSCTARVCTPSQHVYARRDTRVCTPPQHARVQLCRLQSIDRRMGRLVRAARDAWVD